VKSQAGVVDYCEQRLFISSISPSSFFIALLTDAASRAFPASSRHFERKPSATRAPAQDSHIFASRSGSAGGATAPNATLGVLATAIAVNAEPKGLSAPAGKKHVKVEKPAPVTRSEVRGVIPRAVLGGNPLQMLNPKAPARYGTAEQSVAYDPLTGKYDLVHGHYGLWCLAARLQWRAAVVAAFLGDDLLGTITRAGTYSRKSLLVVAVSRWLFRVSDAATVKSEQMRRASRCCPSSRSPRSAAVCKAVIPGQLRARPVGKTNLIGASGSGPSASPLIGTAAWATDFPGAATAEDCRTIMILQGLSILAAVLAVAARRALDPSHAGSGRSLALFVGVAVGMLGYVAIHGVPRVVPG